VPQAEAAAEEAVKRSKITRPKAIAASTLLDQIEKAKEEERQRKNKGVKQILQDYDRVKHEYYSREDAQKAFMNEDLPNANE
jgi:hypothetical protein